MAILAAYVSSCHLVALISVIDLANLKATLLRRHWKRRTELEFSFQVGITGRDPWGLCRAPTTSAHRPSHHAF